MGILYQTIRLIQLYPHAVMNFLEVRKTVTQLRDEKLIVFLIHNLRTVYQLSDPLELLSHEFEAPNK